ncbi:MAG TPA: DUF4142 domain-containing protein [Usitatibacter sp.]|jgi:putative membrane protein|nr:DUF4142 domain-containing protein [Usitatibacter sp.]
MPKQQFTKTALAMGLACLGASWLAGAANVPAADKKFMEDAAVDGMTEVEAGKIAQGRASNADVKQFASRMVEDHTKAGDKLKSIASSKGVALPSGPDKKHQADLDKLSKSQNFDRDYMDAMVKDHKKAVGDFEKQSKSAKDPDVKNFASSTLPTLQEHLKMAEDTDKAVKSAKPAKGK